MTKFKLPIQQAISDIVLNYRRMQSRNGFPMPFREFACDLSGSLTPFGGKISHATINNWENGVHLPNIFTLKMIAGYANQNWQKDFASDLLALLLPESYQPATHLGVAALKWIEQENRRAARTSSSGHATAA